MTELILSDAIEEVLLKEAGSDEICKWLREHAYQPAAERPNNFSDLRAVYEPLWVARGEDKLTMSVCLFGQNIPTLKALMNGQLPIHFKQAVARNPALMSHAGVFDLPSDLHLTPNDIMAIYKGADKNALFLSLFVNEAVNEEFLTLIFECDPPYDEITPTDRLQVLWVLFNFQRKYFSQNAEKYKKNSYHRENATILANAIIKFLSSVIPIYLRIERIPNLAITVRYFLEDSKELKTNGFNEEETLALFDFLEGDFDIGLFEDTLKFIQIELAARGFRYRPYEPLSKLAESSRQSMRSIYFRHAQLTQIYGLRAEELDRFFQDISPEYLNWRIWGQGEEPQSKLRFPKAADALIDLLKREKTMFAASSAVNELYYTSRTRRRFLQEICRQGDLFGGDLPSHVGGYTCYQVFDAKTKQLNDKYPEYFEDESHRTQLEEGLQSLKNDIRSLQPSDNQDAALRHGLSKLQDDIYVIKTTQSQLTAKVDKLMARSHNIAETLNHQAEEPVDLVSRVVFGIPILGRVIKFLLR